MRHHRARPEPGPGTRPGQTCLRPRPTRSRLVLRHHLSGHRPGLAYLCTVRAGTPTSVGPYRRRPPPRRPRRRRPAQAVALRGHLPGKVIFHADRGCQYTSKQIAKLAGELDLLRSMGRTGVCWDNAAAESFWSTFKNEYYHRHVFATISDARRGAYTWIDAW
ncbi:MAG: DDE-type integrase/transposase/recombinase [Micropruina sp.]|nr:DDE-type integrase/transposase/recombinase [Micropruina sp.]